MLYSHSSSKRIFERQPVEANALLSLGTQLQPRGGSGQSGSQSGNPGKPMLYSHSVVRLRRGGKLANRIRPRLECLLPALDSVTPFCQDAEGLRKLSTHPGTADRGGLT